MEQIGSLRDLEYRGEGSAAIVFAFRKTNQVLRLVKSNSTVKIRKKLGSDGNSQANWQSIQRAVKDQLENTVNYVRNVMHPLFSHQFVVVPTLTALPPEFGHKALAMAGQYRPADRRNSSSNSVDTDIQWALVLPDCCFVRQRNDRRGSSEPCTSSTRHCTVTCRNGVGVTARGDSTESLHSNGNLKPEGHTSSPSGQHRQNSHLPGVHCHHSQEIESGQRVWNTRTDPLSPETALPNHQTFVHDTNSHIPEPHYLDIGSDDSSLLSNGAACMESSTEASKLYNEDVGYSAESGATVESRTCPLPAHLTSQSARNDSHISTLSFEIKPKKAFILPSATEKDRQLRVCKFCMHQRLKMKSGKFPEISGYCPLDLFSGDRERMRHSLMAVIKAPQHQLKICKDGQEVYGSEIRRDLAEVLKDWFPQKTCSGEDLVSVFLDLVIETLLHSPKPSNTQGLQKNGAYPNESNLGTESCQKSTNGDCTKPDAGRSDSESSIDTSVLTDWGRGMEVELARLASSHSGLVHGQRCGNSSFPSGDGKAEAHTLPAGCVLEQLSRLQQLDQLDIEGVYPLYKALETKMEESPQLRGMWGWSGPYTDVLWLLGKSNGPECRQAGSCTDQMEEDVLKVKRFLVSKTLQDCSIIVAIKPLLTSAQYTEGGEDCLQFRGAAYGFSVSVIDLDPKSFQKIPYYYTQAVEISTT